MGLWFALATSNMSLQLAKLLILSTFYYSSGNAKTYSITTEDKDGATEETKSDAREIHLHLHPGTSKRSETLESSDHLEQYSGRWGWDGDCPSSYRLVPGDVPGWGSIRGLIKVSSREQCALLCNQEKLCNSFEHSNTDGICNLNLQSAPTTAKYKDYAFCVVERTCRTVPGEKKPNLPCVFPFTWDYW